MVLIQFKHKFSVKILIFVTSIVVPSTPSVFRKKHDVHPDTTKLSTTEASTSEVTSVSYNWTPTTTSKIERRDTQFLLQPSSRNNTFTTGKDTNSSDNKVARFPYYRKAQSVLPLRPSEMEYSSSRAYNNSDNNYYAFIYNTTGDKYFRDTYQNQELSSNQAHFLPPPGPTGKMTHDIPSEQNHNEYENSPSDPNYYWDELQHTHTQPPFHQLWQHEEENESFEIEDKVFSKTVVATKALKVGKIIFTFCMGLVVLVLAGLGKLGVHVSPVVLPLALFPIGVIALLLFIPLFSLFVPLAATGVIGEGKKRRRKRRNVDSLNSPWMATSIMDSLLLKLIEQLPNILDADHWKDWRREK